MGFQPKKYTHTNIKENSDDVQREIGNRKEEGKKNKKRPKNEGET